KARWADHQARAWPIASLGARRSNKCQRLQRFAQTHLIGKDASEAVLSQEMQPSDAILLVWSKNVLKLAECRAFELGFAAQRGNTAFPCRGRIDVPFGILLQGRVEKRR